MRLKFLLVPFLALILGVGAVLPASAGTNVSVTVSTNDPNAMAGLLIGGLMASFFSAQSGGQSVPAPAPVPVPSTQTKVIFEARPQPRPADPWSDLPAWYVASYADVPVERIVELRRSGRSWVQIAERYRLPEEFRGRTVIITESPAGKFKYKNKGKRDHRTFVVYDDREFERFIFVRFLEEYYAVPRATVVVWLDRGLSIHDIFLSVNLATRVRTRPDVIIRYRLSGEPWERIARRYRVAVVDLGRPVIIEHKNRRHVRFEHWKNNDNNGDNNDNNDD